MVNLSLAERNVILRELDYQEARKKPFLFYKRMDIDFQEMSMEVVLFADMRVRYPATVLKTSLPLVYSKVPEETPKWLQNRIERNELKLFMAESLPFTLYKGWIGISYEGIEDYWQWAEDGFCRKCGTDFSSKGLLCTKCRIQELDAAIGRLPKCEIPWCDNRISNGGTHSGTLTDDFNQIVYSLAHFPEDELKMAHSEHGLGMVLPGGKHHTDYERNLTLLVCASCHGKITQKKNEKYRPFWARNEKEKKRKYKLVPCTDCDGKVQVAFDYPYPPPKIEISYHPDHYQTTIGGELVFGGEEYNLPICSKCRNRRERKAKTAIKRKKGQHCLLCGKKMKYNPQRPLCYQCYSGF